MDEVIVEYRLSWSEWRRIYWGASIKKSVSAFLLYIAFVFGVSTLVFSDGSRVQVLVIAIFAVAYFASTFGLHRGDTGTPASGCKKRSESRSVTKASPARQSLWKRGSIGIDSGVLRRPRSISS